jgi:hypothetical protein
MLISNPWSSLNSLFDDQSFHAPNEDKDSCAVTPTTQAGLWRGAVVLVAAEAEAVEL